MALSDVALSAGLATANPLLIGAGVGGKILGGIFGQRSANRLAAIEGQRAAVQNRIFEEQVANERANLLQRRRSIIRQGNVARAGNLVQSASQTGGRASSRAIVDQAITERIDTNVGNIDRAIATGERISALNQQLAELQSESAQEQASQSFINTIF